MTDIDPIEIAKRVAAERRAEEVDPHPLPTVSRPVDPLDIDMIESPDIPGTVKGFRAWQISAEPDDDALLWSVTHSDFAWPPRAPAVAECDRHGSAGSHIPGTTCSCGLYAAKGRSHLFSMGYAMYADGHFRVVGEVMFWGRVIEGSQGWRAQQGYPKKLYVPYEATHLAVPLMKAYGVPVDLMNWLK